MANPTLRLLKNSEWTETTSNGESVSIPKDWSVTPIRNVGAVTTGNTPATKESAYWALSGETAELEWLSTPDLRKYSGVHVSEGEKFLTKEGKGKARVAGAGSVLVSCIATIGEVAVTDRPVAFNQQINAISPTEAFDGHFIKYAFQFNRKRLERYAPVSVVPIINKQQFESFEIECPDFGQQRKIASVLAKHEKLLSDIRDLNDTLIQRLSHFSEELLSGRLRVKEVDGKPLLYKNEAWKEVEVNGEAKQLPTDWTVATMEELFDVVSGQAPSSEFVSSQEIGLEFHQGNSAFDDKYVGASGKSVSPEARPKLAPAQSILISVRAPVGEVNVTTRLLAIGRGLASLSPKNASDLDYLYYVLKLNQREIAALGSGSTFEGMTVAEFKRFETWVSPESTLIAQVLSGLEDEIRLHKQLLYTEKNRFQWLLDNLMTGKYLLQEE